MEWKARRDFQVFLVWTVFVDVTAPKAEEGTEDNPELQASKDELVKLVWLDSKVRSASRENKENQESTEFQELLVCPESPVSEV